MRYQLIHTDFRCLHCRQVVSTCSGLSGVRNRNHCPYCLWSRHLDMSQPGDRLSACKAGMRPLGLTIKRAAKKYSHHPSGELMLIHQCIECGKVSINRVAADDFAENLFEIYQGYRQIDELLRLELETSGVLTLQAADHQLVQSRLFGRN